MSSPLDALCGPTGPLKQEPPDAQEFGGLVRSGEAPLLEDLIKACRVVLKELRRLPAL